MKGQKETLQRQGCQLEKNPVMQMVVCCLWILDTVTLWWLQISHGILYLKYKLFLQPEDY